jgi:hypothetical protein
MRTPAASCRDVGLDQTAHTCTEDQSVLALYYSANLLDWQDAGLVDFFLSPQRRLTSPAILIIGRDLLIVTFATADEDLADTYAATVIVSAVMAAAEGAIATSAHL